MARIGSLYLAVISSGLLTLSLGAQNPPEPPPPFPPGNPEMDRTEKPFRDKKDPNNPGGQDKKDPSMGKRGDGPGMFGPNMGGPQFEKMVELALGPEKDIEEALQKWPRIQDKEPEAQQRFLKQIENFRRMLKGQAMREAQEMGLQIKPGEEDAFVQNFWKKKMEVDRTLRKEMEPRRHELMEQMKDELKKEFGA